MGHMQRLIKMENKLQKLKEVIWKANPEIMELKFGCEVVAGNELHNVIKKPNYFGKEEMTTICGQMIRDWKVLPEKAQILGRKITLFDYLVLLKKVGYNSTEEWLKVLGRVVDIWEYNYLDELPEETVNFLHSLLVKN